MDNNAIWIALIVAVPTTLTALLPFYLKSLEAKTRRIERAEDKAELKEAARRVTDVALRAKEAAALLAINTEKSASDTSRALGDLKKIGDATHVLVNSQSTAQVEDNLALALGNLALLHEIADLKKRSGEPVSPATTEAMAAISSKIQILRETLATKARQNSIMQKL